MFPSYPGYPLFHRLVIYSAIVLFVGVLFDNILYTLLIGSFFLLGKHYYELVKLINWLWLNKQHPLPLTINSWECIFNGLFRLQQEYHLKHNQVLRLLAKYRQAAKAVPDAAIILNEKNDILWCNQLARKMLGIIFPQDLGQRLDNLIRHPDFIYYLNQGDFNEPFEFPSPVVAELLLECRIISYGGEYLLLIIRDVTRLRQLENMRKNFVANVSHELKTPLTVLQGYLEIMTDSADINRPESKSLAVMTQQTQRMQAMVEQLLILSKIEDEPVINYGQSINMPFFMKKLSNEATTLAAEKHKLTFYCDSSINPFGNELQLASACSNLISNAIKYTPAPGEIEVRWEKVIHGGKFSVVDNGLGIENQHIPRLTERFYRIDSARSRTNGGSGLGLAIVKHALKHHHSLLEVNSVPNQGSCFSFTIPHHLLEVLGPDKNIKNEIHQMY